MTVAAMSGVGAVKVSVLVTIAVGVRVIQLGTDVGDGKAAVNMGVGVIEVNEARQALRIQTDRRRPSERQFMIGSTSIESDYSSAVQGKLDTWVSF